MNTKARIGLVMKSLNAEFFQQMQKGAMAFADTHNDFQLLCTGTSTQTEIALQISLIEQLIADKVDAIVLVPIDSKALVPVVAKAIKTGIKVINIDIRLDEILLAQHGISLTYVGPDNKAASKAVGQVLAQKIGKGAKVLLIEGLRVAENAQQRKAGFMEAIDENGLHLLASAPADWETTKAAEVFKQLFKQHPDTEGVMCSNDAMALGVIAVLQQYGKAGQIPVVGFDNDPSSQPFLQAGLMLATIDAFGSEMAVRGIEFALKVLAGMPNEGNFATDYSLILPNTPE